MATPAHSRKKMQSSWAVRLLHVGIRSARAALCLAVILVGVAWFGARSARAQVGEAALGVGRQLAGLEDLTGTTYRVRLNGEPINVATALVSHDLRQVLDRFDRHCRKDSAGAELADVERALSENPSVELPPDASGVLRRESQREGLVACLVKHGGESSLAARLDRFAETLDVSEVGLLRYAYAKRTKSGKTHVVLAWTDGPFRLESLIAGGGKTDAPGSDVAGGARPVDSVRLLSADVDGVPYGTRIYESKADAAAVTSALDRDLDRAGWKRMLGGPNDPPGTRAYSKEGRDLLAFVYPQKSATIVSMVEARAN